MNKFVPIEKMSKKMQKEYHKRRRKDWGGLSPVTRRPENPKAYNRAKAKTDYGGNRNPFDFLLCINTARSCR